MLVPCTSSLGLGPRACDVSQPHPERLLSPPNVEGAIFQVSKGKRLCSHGNLFYRVTA